MNDKIENFELVDIGSVSRDTKGFPVGTNFDLGGHYVLYAPEPSQEELEEL